MKGVNKAEALIAFFATLGPIILLLVIQIDLLESEASEWYWMRADPYRREAENIAIFQLIYQIFLVPIAAIVFLYMRQKSIAIGIGLGFIIGLPIAYITCLGY